jgi:hypothetical protein
MVHSALKWALVLFTALALGPLCASLMAGAPGPHGAERATALVSDAPARALLATLASFGAAALAGVVGARAFSTGTGFAMAGLVLAWAAWGSATVELLARRGAPPSMFTRLAVEGVLTGVCTLALATLLLLAGRHARPTAPDPFTPPPPPPPEMPLKERVATLRAGMLAARTLGCAAIGAAGALGIAWLFGTNALKGQALFAALGAGVVSGVVCTLACAGVSSYVVALAGVLASAVAGVVAPLAAGVVLSDPSARAIAGALQGPFTLVPLDWAAGAMLGVPLGLAWAGSMLDGRQKSEESQRLTTVAGARAAGR